MNDDGVCRTAPVTPGLLKTNNYTNLKVDQENYTLNVPLFNSNSLQSWIKRPHNET